MADDDWFGAGTDDGPPPSPAFGQKEEEFFVGAVAPPAVEGEDPAAAPAAAAGPPVAEEAIDFLDPDKLLLCKHWIRPRFLQYKYIYDYRHNYYDDVIDFLDKRQRGLSREIPRPQTWAERTLRTFSTKDYRSEFFKKIDEDKKLATKMKLTGAFYHYHTREYFNRKYSSIM